MSNFIPKTELSWTKKQEIDQLRRTSYVSEWEDDFLLSVSKQRNLSQKQIDRLNIIFNKKIGKPLIDYS